MAEISKPSNLSLTWASGGDVLDPGTTKYATGWSVEIPPRQWFNYLDNRQDTALAHINQRGVAQWDATTEYQGVKSYVQGSNGTIYRSKQTNTNQEPVADVAGAGLNWQIAFASAGDFYTKAQTDATYVAKASNLSDLTNVATARTNLSVYSQAQTYTKTEVDSKTTVASTAQAQALAVNTVLMTPLRTKEAFNASGSAPFFACRAWCNFDGTASSPSIRGSGNTNTIARVSPGVYDITFSVAMPDANYAVIPTGSNTTTGPLTNQDSVVAYNLTAGGFRLKCFASDTTIEDFGYVQFTVVR